MAGHSTEGQEKGKTKNANGASGVSRRLLPFPFFLLPSTPVRIIAGEFRGRRLLAPKTDATRPITDRVKQSLFDILAPVIPESVVYDTFAGTGSMGLECLSRGAAGVTFFEADRS